MQRGVNSHMSAAATASAVGGSGSGAVTVRGAECAAGISLHSCSSSSFGSPSRCQCCGGGGYSLPSLRAFFSPARTPRHPSFSSSSSSAAVAAAASRPDASCCPAAPSVSPSGVSHSSAAVLPSSHDGGQSDRKGLDGICGAGQQRATTAKWGGRRRQSLCGLLNPRHDDGVIRHARSRNGSNNRSFNRVCGALIGGAGAAATAATLRNPARAFFSRGSGSSNTGRNASASCSGASDGGVRIGAAHVYTTGGGGGVVSAVAAAAAAHTGHADALAGGAAANFAPDPPGCAATLPSADAAADSAARIPARGGSEGERAAAAAAATAAEYHAFRSHQHRRPEFLRGHGPSPASASSFFSASPASFSPSPPDAAEAAVPMTALEVQAFFKRPLVGLGVRAVASGRVLGRVPAPSPPSADAAPSSSSSSSSLSGEAADASLPLQPSAVPPEERRQQAEHLLVALGQRPRPTPVVEVCSRVHLLLGSRASGRVVGGVVVLVNSDGTLGVLLDNNSLEPQVPPSAVYLCEAPPTNPTMMLPPAGPSAALPPAHTAYTDSDHSNTSRLGSSGSDPAAQQWLRACECAAMRVWLRDAGVRRGADLDRLCAVLYYRGWRAPTLHRLTPASLACLAGVLRRSPLQMVLDKAQWQRDYYADVRALQGERIKEREPRYLAQKFSGFVSATWAGLGVASVFLWNFKSYRRQQRSFQLKLAVATLTEAAADSAAAADASPSPETATSTTSAASFRSSRGLERGGAGGAAAAGGAAHVQRAEEENWARQTLRQMDLARPRVAVLTGYRGCGKSALFRAAVRKELLPALFVDVRGAEDTLRCVLRSLRVTNVDACGDPLDFVSEAFARAAQITGEPPLLVVNLREGTDMTRAYHECAALCTERRLCHLVIEVPLESLTMSNTSLPRLDFYTVPNFNLRQAFQYAQHSIDPVSTAHHAQVVGTNSVDIDELFAAVHHRGVSASEYTVQTLAKAMRQVEAACQGSPAAATAVALLAQSAFDSGYSVSGAAAVAETLASPALAGLVLYDPVRDRWAFRRQVLHTAARCCFLTATAAHPDVLLQQQSRVLLAPQT